MTERLNPMKNNTKKSLEVREPEATFETDLIVRPAVNGEKAIQAWQEYLDLKKSIIEEDDKQIIQGKTFLKKSYWRKIATFFNLTVEMVSESHEEINGELVWNFVCKATATNGRSAIGSGSCSAYEKATLKDGKYYQKGEVTEWGYTDNGKKYPKAWKWEPAQPNSIHNIRSTAETRAWNRAVSNLVGGGEVSAEEVDRGQPREEKKTYQPKSTEKKTLTGDITDRQLEVIQKIIKEKNIPESQILSQFGVDSLSKLSKQQASDTITNLQKK